MLFWKKVSEIFLLFRSHNLLAITCTIYYILYNTVREISIRTKDFFMENRLCQVISEKKKLYKNKRNDYSERKFYYEFNIQKKKYQ